MDKAPLQQPAELFKTDLVFIKLFKVHLVHCILTGHVVSKAACRTNFYLFSSCFQPEFTNQPTVVLIYAGRFFVDQILMGCMFCSNLIEINCEESWGDQIWSCIKQLLADEQSLRPRLCSNNTANMSQISCSLSQISCSLCYTLVSQIFNTTFKEFQREKN